MSLNSSVSLFERRLNRIQILVPGSGVLLGQIPIIVELALEVSNGWSLDKFLCV